MSNIENIDFHDQQLVTLKKDGKVWVAMKPISDALGLNWSGQFLRLNRHPVLSTCICMMQMQVAGDKQNRDWIFIDLDYVNGWLFGIDANRVKEELRERVIEYQRECYQVLAKHFRRESSTAKLGWESQERKALAALEKRLKGIERGHHYLKSGYQTKFIMSRMPYKSTSTLYRHKTTLIDFGLLQESAWQKPHHVGAPMWQYSLI